MNLLIIAGGVGLTIVFFVVIFILMRPSRQRELLAEVTNQAYQDGAPSAKAGMISTETLVKPFSFIRRQFGGAPSPEITRRLLLAGYRKSYHADTFLVIKLALPAVLGLAAAFIMKGSVIVAFAVAVFVGFFLPDFWLSFAINKRRESIRLALPDTLDLLAICMEAA